MNQFVAAFSPNREVAAPVKRYITIGWLIAFVTWWSVYPPKVMPHPLEVIDAFSTLWNRTSIGQDFLASITLNIEAILLSAAISFSLAYLTVLESMKMPVAFLSKLRFLGLTGLTFAFGLVYSGHALKLAILTFGLSVFLTTAMRAVVGSVISTKEGKERLDHARTLRMGPWRTVREVVILGTLADAIEAVRQSAAIGWMMLTMVEGLVRSEGGIGTLLLNENKHFRLEAVFAIQVLILVTGLAQDFGFTLLRAVLCPWAVLGESKKVPVAASDKAIVPFGSTAAASSLDDAAAAALEESRDYSYGATLLKISGVNVSYGGNQILRGIDFEVKDITRSACEQGQVIALLGPSGIGKSTLFRVLAGLEEPDEGTVHVTEKQEPVSPGRMGVVFQKYPLLMHRTVIGNLTVAGKQAGLNAADARAKALEFLEEFGIRDKADMFPSQLSGGQQQRVAIAQQLMCSGNAGTKEEQEGTTLLMDEPFSGLDPNVKDKVCETITKVARKNTRNTIVVVTHDIPAALAVADTLVLLGRDRYEDGSVVPGARIVKTYDLIKRGLAWHKDVTRTPQFGEVAREVRKDFISL